MKANRIAGRREVHVPCTVEVIHTPESFEAHVELKGENDIRPGDEVIVHGDPVDVPFGETRVFDRHATIIRASWLENLWTRMTGDIEFMELLEFSFSERKQL